MKHVRTLILSLVLALMPATALAQAERAQQAFLEIVARLELTQDQVREVAPILRESTQRQAAILRSYGIDMQNLGERAAMDFRTAQLMRRELDAARKRTVSALSEILSEEQLEEYRKIQEETRRQVRQRIRTGR